MGNLTRDPETKVTPNGMTICKIGLAVNRKFKTKDGEDREEVVFVDCDAFGRQADTIARYMQRGRPIHIEGRLRLDQWDDRNSGESRSKLGVVIESFQFVGGREESQEQEQQRQQPSKRAATPPQSDFDDDLPF